MSEQEGFFPVLFLLGTGDPLEREGIITAKVSKRNDGLSAVPDYSFDPVLAITLARPISQPTPFRLLSNVPLPAPFFLSVEIATGALNR
jgi:hypothetical protein